MPHSWLDRLRQIGAALIMLSVAWELLGFMLGFDAGFAGAFGAVLLWSVVALACVVLGPILIIALAQRVLGGTSAD